MPYKNPEDKKNNRKKYYLNNKEKINEYAKNNKDIKKKSNKKYSENNKEKIKLWSKEYYLTNKEKIREYKRLYTSNRMKSDPLFKLTKSIKNLIGNSIRRNGYKKLSRTELILGCSFNKFKEHIESKFEPWMTWENRGLYNGELNYGWDLDHIIPSSSAITEEDMIKLNHYTNLQPLCSYINRDIKRNSYVHQVRWTHVFGT